MAYQNLSVFLRNDSVGTITIGTLSISAAGSVQIWDTANYTSGILNNFYEVISNIATFNENIDNANLVMVVNTVDQTIQESFDQFQELWSVYNKLNLAEQEFSALRLDSKQAKGLIINHDDLIDNNDDPHPQYVTVDGSKSFTGNFNLDGYNVYNGTFDGYNISTIYEISGNPSGFTSRTTSTISLNSGTRTFSIAPVSDSYVFYIKGNQFVKTGTDQIVFPDTEGGHYFYFDDTGTLQQTTSGSEFGVVIRGAGASVAYIYWDVDNQEAVLFGEERHGLMDGNAHAHFHNAFGSQWYNGGAITDLIPNQDGSSDTHAQLGVDNVTFADEDIVRTISNNDPQLILAPAQLPIYYRSGTDGYWRKKDADNFPLIYSGTAGFTGSNGRIPFNVDISTLGITFIDATETTGTGTSLSVNVPAGIVDGDFLLAFITNAEGASVTFTPPAGWTLITTLTAGGGGSPTTMAVYYRVASSEPASYTWTASEWTAWTGSMIAYSGVDTSNPLDATTQTATGSGSAPDPASITTVTDGALVVAVGFKDGDPAITDVPTNYSEKVNITQSGGGGDGQAVSIADRTIIAATAENPGSFTAPADGWGAITIALRPVTGSAEDWDLVEANEDFYVLVHYFANNDINEPIVGIQGQFQYEDLEKATEGSETEIGALKGLVRIIGPEFTPLGTVIYQTNSTYANTPQARVVTSSKGDIYIDFRGNLSVGTGGISAIGGVTDHGALNGLSDDDHPMYLLIDGSRSMTGSIDMDGYNITNVGTIDGIDISNHSALHESGGSDEIDGYQLAVVYAPENYGAPDNNVLGEHLSSIDEALAPGSTTVIWVDQNSTSSVENGSINAPYKTVQAALDVMSSSGNYFVNISDGTYNEALSFTTSGYVVFRGLGPSTPWSTGNNIKVGTSWTFSLSATSNITFQNIDFNSNTVSISAGPTGSVIRFDFCRKVTISSSVSTLIYAFDSVFDSITVGSAAGVYLYQCSVQEAISGTNLIVLYASFAYGGLTNISPTVYIELISSYLTGDIEFATPGGLAYLDPYSQYWFLENGGSIVNGSLLLEAGLTETSPSHGSVMFYNGTNWEQLPPGIDGYALTTHGASADPTWEEIVGGGGLTAPSNPTENGYVALANNGDLEYLEGASDGYVLTWNSSLNKWVSSSPVTTSGGADIDMDGYSLFDVGTVTFTSWPVITSDGTDTVNFNNYQKATVDLNDQSSVTITLSDPTGPGNFMLILKQGSSTATTSITWSVSGDIYAPSGEISFASTTSSITIIGLAFDGTDWYAVASQPMQAVV